MARSSGRAGSDTRTSGVLGAGAGGRRAVELGGRSWAVIPPSTMRHWPVMYDARVRGEEDDRAGDLLRLARRARAGSAPPRRLRLSGSSPLRPGRDGAGGDRVDPDPIRREVQRGCDRVKASIAALGRVVGGQVAVRAVGRERADVDDGAGRRRPRRGRRRPARVHRKTLVRFDRTISSQPFRRHVEDVPRRVGEGRVVDQDVDHGRRRPGPRHEEPLHLVGEADVRGDRDGPRRGFGAAARRSPSVRGVAAVDARRARRRRASRPRWPDRSRATSR